MIATMNEPVQIKICGIRTPDVAEAAVEAGAAMVGVVFVPASPRSLSVDQAVAVAAAARGRAEVVGLVKDHSLGEVRQLVDAVGLDLLQLHGEVTGAAVEAAGVAVRCLDTAAFDAGSFVDRLRRVDAGFVETARPAALIVDTPDPSRIGGGTGRTFDWSALRQVLDEVQPRVPIMLAGGLTPDNVAEAIRIIRPWGVDVSSGVESQRGVKDIAKIRAFCRAVRSVG